MILTKKICSYIFYGLNFLLLGSIFLFHSIFSLKIFEFLEKKTQTLLRNLVKNYKSYVLNEKTKQI
jgi:hypothetical protein